MVFDVRLKHLNHLQKIKVIKMSNLDIKKECFSCNSRSECKNYYSYDEENCDKYYPDDMELPIWVFETIDNRYVGKECCRTKFLYKAEIGTYMELYENGIAAFNDGSHDIYSSGIIKISDVSACNKRE